MRGFGLLVLLGSVGLAHAEQPRGTYTLDRSALITMTDGNGRPHPSCGGEKLFSGQATFVVEYSGRDTIRVNQRAWRFEGHTTLAGGGTPPPDAQVIAMDPDSKDRITLWFGVNQTTGRASGNLNVTGTRAGKFCADAWRLHGTFRY